MASCFFAGVLACPMFIPALARSEDAPEGAAESDSVARQVEDICRRYKLPGLVYLRMQDDEVEAWGAVGIRRRGKDLALTRQDKMHLGSCTKAMTAAMLATLVQEGKLQWSTRIRDVFADRLETIHPDFHDVTLELLLRHRGGQPANVVWRKLKGETTTEQRRQLIDTVLARKPVEEPGTAFLYSNVGYAIAGLMAEETAQRSWEELMRKRIFEPLAMKSAGFGIPGKKGGDDQPWGHSAQFLWAFPDQIDNPACLGPAGTVHCSLDDWAKFARVFTDRGREDNPILRRESVQRLVKIPSPEDNYAFGWRVLRRAWAGGVALAHNGSNTRWQSTVWISPRRNLVLLAVANAGMGKADEACDQVIVAMLDKEL